MKNYLVLFKDAFLKFFFPVSKSFCLFGLIFCISPRIYDIQDLLLYDDTLVISIFLLAFFWIFLIDMFPDPIVIFRIIHKKKKEE